MTKKDSPVGFEILENDMDHKEEKMAVKQTAGRDALGEFAPKFAQYFTGQSYLAPISADQVGIFNVTFEPGCRNNWHIHHAKSGGKGTGVKHWHGATPYSWFSHLAVEVPAEEGSNEWLEPVDEDAYMRALC